MTKDEALRLALEALEYPGPSWIEARQPAITAIKAALEAKDEPVSTGETLFRQFMSEAEKVGVTHLVPPQQEAKDEPVSSYGHCPVCGAKGAIRERHPDGNTICVNRHTYKSRDALLTPPQRKPLTDEEIQQIFIANSVVVDNGNAYMVAGLRTVNIARAIEAAHGITGENNG